MDRHTAELGFQSLSIAWSTRINHLGFEFVFSSRAFRQSLGYKHQRQHDSLRGFYKLRLKA